jgi:hypothetical protein
MCFAGLSPARNEESMLHLRPSSTHELICHQQDWFFILEPVSERHCRVEYLRGGGRMSS